MNYEFICAYCKVSFVPKRTDAKYCSNSCRYKTAHVKRLEKAFLKEKQARIAKVLEGINKEKELLRREKEDEKQEREQEENLNKFLDSYKKILLLPHDKFYQLYTQYELKKVPYQSNDWHETNDYLRFCSIQEQRSLLQEYLNKLGRLKKKLEKSTNNYRLFDFDIFKKERLEKLEQELQKLEQEEFIPPELPTSSSSSSSLSSIKKKRKRLHPKELGAKDILNLNFNTFILPGELGRFLGELDRNMIAIALTGDSGAGKTYLSFALAKLFITAKMKVKYFSLEEGIGKLTQEKIAFYELGNNLKMTAEGTLEEIQKDAEYFDVIIVDSYSKLTTKPEEFEELRQDFPDTIFIIIFQKTTSGSIRGGSSIKYNSSATIDVILRDGRPTSIMKKSRYGTQNWEYDNKSGQITKEI